MSQCDSMKTSWVAGAAIGLVGCSGSASLVLKTPVSNQCAKAGLLGCDQLSEGVLLYAEGKGSEGAAKLQSGAAQNSPEKVKQFAAQLDTLSSLPGAGTYAAALSEVAATLTLSAASSSAAKSGSPEDDAALASRSPLASSGARGIVTADTDVAQNRSGVAELPSSPPEWCEKFGKGTSCLLLGRGPLFLTEARAPRADCEGQFLAIIEGGRVSVELNSPLSIHGARILVPEGAALVLGQRPAPPKEEPSADAAPGKTPAPGRKLVAKLPAKPVEKPIENNEPDYEESDVVILDEVPPEWSCSLYFSGFVPYGTRPRGLAHPHPEFERPIEKSWNHEDGL